jgi:DNA-binding HxlR family transcriptional regulator
MSPTCTTQLEQSLNLLGKKWVLLIIYNLCSSKKGFNELQRSVSDISPRILSARLSEMAAQGLIHKTVFPTTPPRVEYALTAKGESLKHIMLQLGSWAENSPA